MSATLIGGIEDTIGPCSWSSSEAPDAPPCGRPGRLSGFGCPGYRALFACEVHDPLAGKRPVGFRHHRLRRGVGMSRMYRALAWSATLFSGIETGRVRMDRLQLTAWWTILEREAKTEESAQTRAWSERVRKNTVALRGEINRVLDASRCEGERREGPADGDADDGGDVPV